VGVASAEELLLGALEEDEEAVLSSVEQAARPVMSRPAVVSPSAVLVKLRMMCSFAVGWSGVKKKMMRLCVLLVLLGMQVVRIPGGKGLVIAEILF
jgi:hypothetical protein